MATPLMTEDQKINVRSELVAYEQVSSIYGQIFSLQEFVMRVSEIYLVVTGAAWTAALSNELGLPRWMKAALCLFVAIGGLQLWITIFGAIRSIKARFELIDSLGEASFPTILHLGRSHFNLKTPKWTSWGKNRKNYAWYLIVFVGTTGSIVLSALILLNLIAPANLAN